MQHRQQEEPRWVMQEQLQQMGAQVNPPKPHKEEVEKKEGQAA